MEKKSYQHDYSDLHNFLAPTLDCLLVTHCTVRLLFISPVLKSKYYDSLVRLFIFGKIPCHVRLFHTVQLLESSEY